MDAITRAARGEMTMTEPREKLSDYERGEWDMFQLITSVEYGKQCYSLEEDPDIVYSRRSHTTMKREDAYKEYLKYIGW